MTKIRNTIAYIQTIKIAKSELQPSDHINKGKDKAVRYLYLITK